MAAAWQAYRWNSARPKDSSIRLGSSAHTCTHPEAMAGSSARISDQITEPFPDPVAPAISTCVAASRSRQGVPSSHRPTGSLARSTSLVMGSAGIGSARVSARTSSSSSTPGARSRTRHSRAPNACARFSDRSAKSAGACPVTRPTRTRSTAPALCTRSRTGSIGCPR